MTTPFTSPDALPRLMCACASLRRASRAVTQLYDEALRGSGVHPTQFTMLQVLARRGEITQGELGRFLATDSTTLSRTLRPMRQDGWITVRSGDDGRERRLSITAKGRAVVEKVRPAWEGVQQRLRDRLGAEHWDRLLGELAAVAGVAGAA